MHRLICNELRLDFSVLLLSPVSIREAGADRFVQAIYPGSGELSVYLPGSTLKGALRAATEQAARAAGVDCCDPEHPCSDRETIKRASDGAAVYRTLCSVCKLFGSRAMRSHLLVSDAFPADPVPAPPGYEAVSEETFYGTLEVRNFERWQIGLLAKALARINMSDVQIGANRSGGMGCIATQYRSLSLIYPGPEPSVQQQDALRTKVHGVGQLMGANTPYGFVYPDVAPVADLPDSATLENPFGYTCVVIKEYGPSEAAIEVADMPEVPDLPERLGQEETVQEPSEPESPAEAPGIEAEQVHGLIDNVLTRQALAWNSYARTHKGSR